MAEQAVFQEITTMIPGRLQRIDSSWLNEALNSTVAGNACGILDMRHIVTHILSLWGMVVNHCCRIIMQTYKQTSTHPNTQASHIFKALFDELFQGIVTLHSIASTTFFSKRFPAIFHSQTTAFFVLTFVLTFVHFPAFLSETEAVKRPAGPPADLLAIWQPVASEIDLRPGIITFCRRLNASLVQWLGSVLSSSKVYMLLVPVVYMLLVPVVTRISSLPNLKQALIFVFSDERFGS